VALLDKAIDAQKGGEFAGWYNSLSPTEREQFNREISAVIGRIRSRVNELLEAIPCVIVELSRYIKPGPSETK
jgi:hypothetical protein